MNGEGNGKPLQYSCLENPMDGGPWWAAVHGVATSRTRLSDFTFTFHLHAMEKEMATHSSVLVWRIPGTAEPGGLLSMGSHRVGHDWRDLAAVAVFMKYNRILWKSYILKTKKSKYTYTVASPALLPPQQKWKEILRKKSRNLPEPRQKSKLWDERKCQAFN